MSDAGTAPAGYRNMQTPPRSAFIDIPGDIYFIGAIRNTASDGMTYFETEGVLASHHHEYTTKERCRLLPLAPKDPSPSQALRHMVRRSVVSLRCIRSGDMRRMRRL